MEIIGHSGINQAFILKKTVGDIPTAFSPNGNGVNEGFGIHPLQYEFIREIKLEVFSGWGERGDRGLMAT